MVNTCVVSVVVVDVFVSYLFFVDCLTSCWFLCKIVQISANWQIVIACIILILTVRCYLLTNYCCIVNIQVIFVRTTCNTLYYINNKPIPISKSHWKQCSRRQNNTFLVWNLQFLFLRLNTNCIYEICPFQVTGKDSCKSCFIKSKKQSCSSAVNHRGI